MGQFFIVWHAPFSPPVVLTQEKSMICVDNQHSVFPHIPLIHFVQHLSQTSVTVFHKSVILFPHVFHGLLILPHRSVGRPVRNKWFVRVEPLSLKSLRRCKRFMWVKGLDLQKPVVKFAVAPDKIDSICKRLRLWKQRIICHRLAVGIIFPAAPFLSLLHKRRHCLTHQQIR